MGVQEVPGGDPPGAGKLDFQQTENALSRRHVQRILAIEHAARFRRRGLVQGLGPPDPQGLTPVEGFGDGPGVEGEHLPLEFDGGPSPVEDGFFLADLGGIGCGAFILVFGLEVAALQFRESLHQGFRPQFGQAVAQFPGRFSPGDRTPFLEQHRTGVEPGFDKHNGDARFPVAGQHRALDGRGPAPAWQQGGMNVDAPPRRDVDDGPRQQEAVGDDDHQFRPQGAKLLLNLGVFQGLGLEYRQSRLQRQLLDRAGHEFPATAGGPVRLGVDGAQTMFRGQ